MFKIFTHRFDALLKLWELNRQAADLDVEMLRVEKAFKVVVV